MQAPGYAVRMKAEQLKTEFNRRCVLQLLLLYTQALWGQVSQSVACNRHHIVEKRLARWLLTVQDQIQSDAIHLG